MPDIDQQIHQVYGDRGVRVVGLHNDEPPDLIEDFQEQTGVTFPLLVDEGYTLGLFSFPDGVGYPYPRDVVIGPDLTIHAIKNSFEADEMTALVESLLDDIE